MGLLRYIAIILKFALSQSFGRAATISAFTSAILYGIGKLFKLEAIMNIDWWWLPLIVLVVIFAIRLLLTPYWIYKKIEKERNDLLNATSQNGVVVLKQNPALFIGIENTDFGLSGDSGYPPCDSSGHKARWIRLGIGFKGNVHIETLELVISGREPIPAFEWEPGQGAYYFYFQIPNFVKSNEERTIQVQAFANGTKWGSPEESIKFPVL